MTKQRFDVRYPTPSEYLPYILDGDVVVFRSKYVLPSTLRGYGETRVGVVQTADVGGVPVKMVFWPTRRTWSAFDRITVFEFWRGVVLLAKVQTTASADEFLDCPGHPAPLIGFDDFSAHNIEPLDFTVPRDGDVVEFRLQARGRSKSRSAPLRGIWSSTPEPRVLRLPASDEERSYPASPETMTLRRVWRNGRVIAQERPLGHLAIRGGVPSKPPARRRPSRPVTGNQAHLDMVWASKRLPLDKLTSEK